MQRGQKENTPVIYNAGATKIVHFIPYKGKVCFPLHWHERMEILYIHEGSLEYICGGERGTVSAGQVLLVPPRIAHYAKALTDSVYDALMFDLQNFYNGTEVCKKYLTAIFDGNADFDTVVTDGAVLDTIDRLCTKTAPDSLLAVADVYTLLHLLVSRGFIKINQRPRDMGVREITDYIEQNFDKELSTAVLCDKFGYTTAHFCRKFKKATGLTPVAYIKIYRLERAYKMIKQGEGQIFEIASKCGFSDTNYFTRCFTAHYKHPPTYYKK